MLHKINEDLFKCEKALYMMQSKYGELAKTAANARYVYDQAWANAMLNIAHQALKDEKKLPTVALMEAEATVIIAAEMLAVRIAESELDGAKKHIDTTQGILSSVQSRVKMELMEATLTK